MRQAAVLGRLGVEYGGVGGKKGRKRKAERGAGKAEGGTAVPFNDMLHFPEREATTRKDRDAEEAVRVGVIFQRHFAASAKDCISLVTHFTAAWLFNSQTNKHTHTHICNKPGL